MRSLGSTNSELFDLQPGTWSAGPALNQQRSTVAVGIASPSGQVLVAGGGN